MSLKIDRVDFVKIQRITHVQKYKVDSPKIQRIDYAEICRVDSLKSYLKGTSGWLIFLGIYFLINFNVMWSLWLIHLVGLGYCYRVFIL